MSAEVRHLCDLLAASPLPTVDGGKEARGNVVVVGGSPSCPGAAVLAGQAALRCGSGRVQLIVHPAVTAAVGAAFPEALVLGWDPGSTQAPEPVRARLEQAAAVLVGPGVEGAEDARRAARAACAESGCAVVLDAHAIRAVREDGIAAAQRVIVAPNPREARELLGRPPDDETTEAALACRVADLVGGPVAVRGATSVVAAADGRCWATSPRNPGLGTPGSGDVFAGALAALLARGAAPVAALGWAVAAHAEAGALLAARQRVGFLAREVADALPQALAALETP